MNTSITPTPDILRFTRYLEKNGFTVVTQGSDHLVIQKTGTEEQQRMSFDEIRRLISMAKPTRHRRRST